jgi:hypothetical protein
MALMLVDLEKSRLNEKILKPFSDFNVISL